MDARFKLVLLVLTRSEHSFMTYWKSLLLIIFTTILSPLMAFEQSGCAKDALGRVLCSPPGGYAEITIAGVVCAPGQCVADNLGYLKCSSELGGSAIKDNLGRVMCVGRCIAPTKEFCIQPSKD